jgi:SAM-dependent methyltransferase
VLDVACGTGILAREVFARVGPDGGVSGLDPSPGMLAVARRVAPGIAWRQGAAEALPYPDGTFDAVVSQFGLMFFADRRKALSEMLRVLVPAGRMAVAVWDSLDRTPAYAAEVALLDRAAGTRAGDALRAPFVLGDPRGLEVLLGDAGAVDVAVATHHGTGRFPSVRVMVESDLRGWLPVMGVHLSEAEIGRVLSGAPDALGAFVTPAGRVEFDSPALIGTGTKGGSPYRLRVAEGSPA